MDRISFVRSIITDAARVSRRRDAEQIAGAPDGELYDVLAALAAAADPFWRALFSQGAAVVAGDRGAVYSFVSNAYERFGRQRNGYDAFCERNYTGLLALLRWANAV
jgi:hypothetical protein